MHKMHSFTFLVFSIYILLLEAFLQRSEAPGISKTLRRNGPGKDSGDKGKISGEVRRNGSISNNRVGDKESRKNDSEQLYSLRYELSTYTEKRIRRSTGNEDNSKGGNKKPYLTTRADNLHSKKESSIFMTSSQDVLKEARTKDPIKAIRIRTRDQSAKSETSEDFDSDSKDDSLQDRKDVQENKHFDKTLYHKNSTGYTKEKSDNFNLADLYWKLTKFRPSWTLKLSTDPATYATVTQGSTSGSNNVTGLHNSSFSEDKHGSEVSRDNNMPMTTSPNGLSGSRVLESYYKNIDNERPEKYYSTVSTGAKSSHNELQARANDTRQIWNDNVLKLSTFNGSDPENSGTSSTLKLSAINGSHPENSGTSSTLKSSAINGSDPETSGTSSTLKSSAINGNDPETSGTSSTLKSSAINGSDPETSGTSSILKSSAINGSDPENSRTSSTLKSSAINSSDPETSGTSSTLKSSAINGSDPETSGSSSTLKSSTLEKTEIEEQGIHEEKNYKENFNSSGCQKCEGIEMDIKLLRIKTFRNLLVRKLRLDSKDSYKNRKHAKTEHRVPRLPDLFVEQTFKDNAREFDKDEFHAKDQELIIAGEDMGRDCVKLHVTGCYIFNLKSKIKGEIAEAYLWVYKMKDPNDVSGQTFNLYELERLKSGRLAHSSMIMSEESSVGEGWVALNVTRSLRKWADKGKGSEMLAIRCVTCATRSHRALYGTKLVYKPLLVIKYDMNSENSSRFKRSLTCDPRYECCKRDLTVNFHDIGMTDILQPRNIAIGYCYGECNEIQQYTYNHTSIKQRARWSDSLAHQHTMRLQLKPCCAPMILKDIFIMTSDSDGTIVRKLLPKVIVDSCGCL